MCGRFTQAYTWRELVALYRLTQPAINLQPHYNIAPTTTIDVVIPRGGECHELVSMRWGLIPSRKSQRVCLRHLYQIGTMISHRNAAPSHMEIRIVNQGSCSLRFLICNLLFGKR
jgi:putative SOS response-associated peptidase YedK